MQICRGSRGSFSGKFNNNILVCFVFLNFIKFSFELPVFMIGGPKRQTSTACWGEGVLGAEGGGMDAPVAQPSLQA